MYSICSGAGRTLFCSLVHVVRLVNISPDDIVDGNPKLTLALVWAIILHFQARATQVGRWMDMPHADRMSYTSAYLLNVLVLDALVLYSPSLATGALSLSLSLRASLACFILFWWRCLVSSRLVSCILVYLSAPLRLVQAALASEQHVRLLACSPAHRSLETRLTSSRGGGASASRTRTESAQ